jgi:hypothetical protein
MGRSGRTMSGSPAWMVAVCSSAITGLLSPPSFIVLTTIEPLCFIGTYCVYHAFVRLDISYNMVFKLFYCAILVAYVFYD